MKFIVNKIPVRGQGQDQQQAFINQLRQQGFTDAQIGSFLQQQQGQQEQQSFNQPPQQQVQENL